MSDEDFFKNYDSKSVFISGVIVEVKYNQIGDFHTGELPTQREQKQMYWGARYANVNVEDAGGVQNRIKFDIDIFDAMRPLIDAGVGTPVVVNAVANKKFQNMRANFAIDLESYRKRVEAGEKLDVWEQMVAGKHPALVHDWKTKKLKKKRVNNKLARPEVYGTGFYCGVVTHIRKKFDKNENEMVFLTLTGVKESIDVVCFSSNWIKIRRMIHLGDLVVAALDKQPDKWRKGGSYILLGGKKGITVLKKNQRSKAKLRKK
jgi:DNA polymerase III alpha subunit